MGSRIKSADLTGLTASRRFGPSSVEAVIAENSRRYSSSRRRYSQVKPAVGMLRANLYAAGECQSMLSIGVASLIAHYDFGMAAPSIRNAGSVRFFSPLIAGRGRAAWVAALGRSGSIALQSPHTLGQPPERAVRADILVDPVEGAGLSATNASSRGLAASGQAACCW